MTPETYLMLKKWQNSGNSEQKRHAANRLSLPDALDYQSSQSMYPSMVQQTKNMVRAVGSVVASIVRGESVRVPQEEQDRRLSICHVCEFWDPAQERCRKCGCFGQWKTWLASQHCPDDPPRW